MGFYRVRYTSQLLDKLMPAVRSQQLPSTDRLSLQNDVFALASSGAASTVDFLRVLESFEEEVDFTVWNDINGKLAQLNVLLWSDDVTHARFKRFTSRLFRKLAARLGWDRREGDDHLTNMLRSLVIGRLGSCGNQQVLNESQKRFKAHFNKCRPLDADLRAPVYNNVLSLNDSKVFDDMINLHNRADLHEEKVRIEKSLGSVTDPSLIERVLDFSMSDKVRNNDRVFVMGSVAMSSAVGRDAAWKFVKNHWDELHQMYRGMFLMSRLVKLVTENFATNEMADEVEKFFKDNAAEAAERTVQQSVEQIRQKAAWWKRDGDAIKRWLEQVDQE